MSEVSQGRLKDDFEKAETERADPKTRDQPGGQERPMSEDEALDESLDETFPASDPAPAKQIDGPNN